MSFIPTSRARVIAQLNQQTGRSFGVSDFGFGSVSNGAEGTATVVLTPIDESINGGNPIILNYPRRVIRDTAKVASIENFDIEQFLDHLSGAIRSQIDPASALVVSDNGLNILVIDDYVVDGEITLEISNETLRT